MALIQPPTFMQNRSDHTARGDRLGMASVALTSGKSTPDDLLVTQNGTPDMNVLVGPGSVWIHGTNATRQGVYHCVNDGNELVAVSPAHASLQRLDILVAEVRDAFYGGSDNDWQLRVVTGAAGSGSEPAVPTSAVRLARITVPASATSITNANITNYHPIAKIGGPLVVENSAERLALVAPDGLMVFQRDTKLTYVYDSVGSTWWTVQTSPGAWTTITLDSGRTVDASHPVPAYRLEDNGDTLRLRGTRISFGAGLVVTSGTDYPLASGANALAAAARPVQERYGTARTYNAATPFLARITLSNTGVLSFRPSVNATIFAIEWGDQIMYLKG